MQDPKTLAENILAQIDCDGFELEATKPLSRGCRHGRRFSLMSVWISFVFALSMLAPAMAFAQDPLGPRHLREHRCGLYAFDLAILRSPTTPPGPEGAPGLPEVADNACTSEDLIGLGPDELVVYLQTTDMNCLRYVWTYDDNVSDMLVDDANLVAVLGAIETLSPTYQGDNDDGLEQLMFTARIRYYHGYFHPADFTESDIEGETIAAFDAFTSNPNINLFAAETAKILNEWINATDAAGIGHHYLDTLESILADFVGARVGDYYQNYNVYSVAYLVTRGSSGNAAFQATVGERMLFALETAAYQPGLYPDHNWLINNIVYGAGSLAQVPRLTELAVSTLTAMLDQFPYLTGPWIWTVAALDDFADCQTSDPGVTICRGDIVPAIEELVFPNTFEHDDGGLVFRTALEEEEVRDLVFAIEQVHAQAARVAAALRPVDGDPNGSLTLKIYGSTEHYETYHTFLSGLPTNNGGIYIEQHGTLYTYNREPTESEYTLEELVRHEYAHYAIGRHVVSGMWGEERIYADSRLVFFDEGMAEFLTGATRGKGVLPRRQIAIKLSTYPSHLSLDELLAATYSTYGLYDHGAAFFNFLYEEHLYVLRELVDVVASGDTVPFDTLIAILSADTELQMGYTAYIDLLEASIDELEDPVTTAPEPRDLDEATPTAIQHAFRSTALGRDATCELDVSKIEPWVACRGTLVGDLMSGEDDVEVWEQFDADLNALVAELPNASTANNLERITCTFAEHRYESSGDDIFPVTVYACGGPLRPSGQSHLTPVVQMTSDMTNTEHGMYATCEATGQVDVVCSATVTTPLFPNDATEEAMLAEVYEALTLTHDELYATRPAYYHDLACTLVGTPEVVPVGNEQYMIGDIECAAAGLTPPILGESELRAIMIQAAQMPHSQ